jgi:hypothetical protein
VIILLCIVAYFSVGFSVASVNVWLRTWAASHDGGGQPDQALFCLLTCLWPIAGVVAICCGAADRLQRLIDRYFRFLVDTSAQRKNKLPRAVAKELDKR